MKPKILLTKTLFPSSRIKLGSAFISFFFFFWWCSHNKLTIRYETKFLLSIHYIIWLPHTECGKSDLLTFSLKPFFFLLHADYISTFYNNNHNNTKIHVKRGKKNDDNNRGLLHRYAKHYWIIAFSCPFFFSCLCTPVQMYWCRSRSACNDEIQERICFYSGCVYLPFDLFVVCFVHLNLTIFFSSFHFYYTIFFSTSAILFLRLI